MENDITQNPKHSTTAKKVILVFFKHGLIFPMCGGEITNWSMLSENKIDDY